MRDSAMARAAARLRHDLGKYVRFSAPETIEADTAALRERLRSDVLATRRTTSTVHGAGDVFEEWRREEAGHFPATGPAVEALGRLARTMDEIGRLSGQIDSLDRPGLERLDALTLAVVGECRTLAIEADR